MARSVLGWPGLILSIATDYLVAWLLVTYARHTRLSTAGNKGEDSLSPSLIPSVALGNCEDRVLAEIDQDGFVFAVNQLDSEFFSSKSEMTPRIHNRIEIVLRGGAIYLRKSAIKEKRVGLQRRVFCFLRSDFYMETAALLRLRELDFIPAIQRFDTRQAVIEMDYIWGRDLRQIISMDAENIDYDDVSRKFDAIMAADDQNEVSMQMSRILGEVVARGVILRDIHAGNFIQGRHSNKLYLVDFNFVHLRSAFKNVS